jgi:hypothetical protein
MTTFRARENPTIMADLDGWSFEPDIRSYPPQPNSYMQDNSDDFGFDPPNADGSMPSIESHYSPKTFDTVEAPASWPGIQSDPQRVSLQRHFDEPAMHKKTPYAASALSRHGQITPPRSNSATSSASMRASVEQEPLPSRRKRTTKVDVKSEDSPKTETSATPRKRKTSRKSTGAPQAATNPEDDKRKMSLEKNRLAAAKCRVNKKERTDQLQRDSHDKAVENNFLKQTILQMKEEVQQLQTILLSHSSSDHCKNPESIHEALGAPELDSISSQMAGNHFLSMQPQARDTTMRQLGHDQSLLGDYFQPREAPALPEFNMSEFEVRTPMLE